MGEPAADDSTNDSQQNVENHSLPPVIDEVAGNKARQQSQQKPGKKRHNDPLWVPELSLSVFWCRFCTNDESRG